jgi:hypothetical protein
VQETWILIPCSFLVPLTFHKVCIMSQATSGSLTGRQQLLTITFLQGLYCGVLSPQNHSLYNYRHDLLEAQTGSSHCAVFEPLSDSSTIIMSGSSCMAWPLFPSPMGAWTTHSPLLTRSPHSYRLTFPRSTACAHAVLLA